MNLLQKIISYVYPLTKKFKSDFNGDLEVTIIDGRKVLDSANANYSYGSLQRILKFALQQISLAEVNNVLLLGLGGGSVIETLRLEMGFPGHISAVEIDPVIIKIARDEFGVINSEKLQITCADALDFVRTVKERYDLIIVDLFIDTKIPDKFLLLDFWQNVQRRMSLQGTIIFNTIGENVGTAAVKDWLMRLGLNVQVFPWVEQTNTLLIARYH
jgi:spermidine synthase